MTPPCSVCGFDIESEPWVYSRKHMLRVQQAMLTQKEDPRFVGVGDAFWVCAEHHAPMQVVLEVVTTGAAEQARLAAPPLVPAFWPAEVLTYEGKS